MKNIAEIMNENLYAQSYRMLYEVEQKAQSKAEQEGTNTNVVLRIFNDRSKGKQYNTPTANEVAVVFVKGFQAQSNKRNSSNALCGNF